jgi:plasmid stabilization system protein ParE
MKVIWSPLALEQMSEIVDFISQDNPVAAGEWIEAAFKRVEPLAQFPESGRHLAELPNRHDIRELIYGHYRIIYRIGSHVAILTVRHDRQLLLQEEITS